MKNLLVLVFIIANFVSAADHHQQVNVPRKYYEYDIDGTRGDRIKRTIGHGTIKAITLPFRAFCVGYRGTRHVVRSAKHNAEIFLSDAGQSNVDRQKLHEILQGWENSDDLKIILKREHRKGNRFLCGLPHDAWKLLKNTLYTAGVRLPRAMWHVLKNVVMSSKDLVIA